MSDNIPHIALYYDEQVPTELLDEFCESVRADSLRLEIKSRPALQPWASVEWLAFPALAVLVLKPYLDGFLKEAGADHYHVLKGALISLWGKLVAPDREIRFLVINRSGAKKLEYSMTFAIYATLADGKVVKLLIPEDCPEQEYSAGVEAFLDFVESYDTGMAGSENALDLDAVRQSGNISLVSYDNKSKSLRTISIGPNSQDGIDT